MRLLETLLPSRLGTQFRWLLGSSWASNLGDGIVLAAGPLLIASQTTDPRLVALAALLQRLPWLLFGLYAGVLADRLDRIRLSVAVDLLRMLVLVGLLGCIATDRIGIGLILAVVFLLGVAEVFADTTAGTLLPMLVEKRDLGVANARLTAGFLTVNQLIGPPIGAGLFALGLLWPFVAQAVVLGCAVLMLSRIRVRRSTPAAVGHSTWAEMVSGLVWTWRSPAVRTLTLTIVTFNVTYGAAWSVLVLYATEVLDMGEVGFGLLTSAGAVGGMIGVAGYDWLERRFRLGDIMRVGLILETLTHLALALTRSGGVALVVMVVFGAHAFVWGVTSRTVRMRAVPEELQGRVGSVYLVGVFGSIVVGNALGGVLASAWGLLAPFWFAFVGSAVLVVLVWGQMPHIAHTDDPDGDADDETVGAAT